ncbi:MAG: TIGR01777 family oxidoreductase [Planctomycetales bacterium]|nr:TIGR01777 family oxidoreductase [Planctomycetales bacterium]
MRIAVTGATGLVGQALLGRLKREGDEVVQITRRRAGTGVVHWSVQDGRIDAAPLEGVDIVVHLAGENIAQGRWSEAKKARIRDSRQQGTELISRTVAGLSHKPAVLVCASAVGFYGDRGDEILTEDKPRGSGFLPEVCHRWEGACQPAIDAGIRVVNLRYGMLLSKRDGALAKMLLPFRLGLGGPIGSGRQWWSWLDIADAVGVILHAARTDSLHGPVNAVAPEVVTNAEFTRSLAKAVHRPAFLPMPAFAARLALGEMANDLLLASLRVVPQRLQETGYQFEFPKLDESLASLLAGTR